MSVAELSLRRPVTTVMLFVSLFVVGLIASFRLPLEALPDVSAPFLFVQLPYAGSTPEEVERNVLRPAEETLATMTGIKRLRGRADSEGASVIMEFSDWERDVAITASEARERIDAIRSELPDDFRRYFVFKFSTSDQPVLRVRLAGDTDLTGAYDLIDRQLKRRIERVPGVARVDISGAPPNEVEIAIDPERLGAHGVELNALAQRLQAANFSVSAGLIEDGGQRLRVQPVGEIDDLEQLREMSINNSGLRLRDVADVRLRPLERGDLHFVHELNNNRAVMSYWFEEPYEAFVELEELFRKHIHDQSERRFIVEDGSHARVGMVELVEIDHLHRRAEFAIMISPAHQGRGYARPATALAIAYAFRVLNLYKLFLLVDVDNAAAIHVYESLGFQREGLLVDEFFSDGRYRSAIRMCLFQHQALGSDDSRRDA